MNKTNFIYLALSVLLLISCTSSKPKEQQEIQIKCSTQSNIQSNTTSTTKNDIQSDKNNKPLKEYYLKDLKTNLSLEKIKDLFPTDSIEEHIESIEEGTIEVCVTSVQLNNKETLKYYWGPNKKHQSLKSMCVFTSAYFGEESTIHKNRKYDIKLSVSTPQKKKADIYLGMPIEELEKAIGAFEFCGFDWDCSGMVIREGKKELEHVTICLGLPQTSTKEIDKWSGTPGYKRLIGDGTFKSSNKDALKLNLQVIYISINRIK